MATETPFTGSACVLSIGPPEMLNSKVHHMSSMRKLLGESKFYIRAGA